MGRTIMQHYVQFRYWFIHEEGQALTEYGLIVVLIIFIAAIGMPDVGQKVALLVNGMATTVVDALSF